MPALPLSTRSLIPFNQKPKIHKLKLNPNPQNPPTTHTPHHRGGGGAPPYIRTIYALATRTQPDEDPDHLPLGERERRAAERVTIYRNLL